MLALLVQEGIVDPETEDRVNWDVEVVQLGDLGHFGEGGSPTGDKLLYEKVTNWFDRILWGNHDYALFNRKHSFKGIAKPAWDYHRLFQHLENKRVISFAHQAHGYLLTHAGLHPYFDNHACPPKDRAPDTDDPKELAAWINSQEDNKDRNSVIHAIPEIRGGWAQAGGTLWRDTSENLLNIPQVFGHTKGDKVRTYQNGTGQPSYCIDTGTKTNGEINGIWLPDQRVVGVKVNAKVERPNKFFPWNT
jgi:hypothetical protein